VLESSQKVYPGHASLPNRYLNWEILALEAVALMRGQHVLIPPVKESLIPHPSPVCVCAACLPLKVLAQQSICFREQRQKVATFC